MGSLPFTLLKFAFPATCLGLGTWQIRRHLEKQQLIQQVEETMKAEPEELRSLADLRAPSAKYKRWLLKPQPTGKRMLVGPKGVSIPNSRASGYGFNVFECTLLPSGESLLLNRGILPLASEREALPPLQPQTVVVLDKEDSKSIFGTVEKNGKLLLKDWSLIGKTLGVSEAESQVAVKVVASPISDLDSAVSKHQEGPIMLHRLSAADIPNRHFEYILTWYSLAALSAAMGFFKK